jgi:hypothetical protein
MRFSCTLSANCDAGYGDRRVGRAPIGTRVAVGKCGGDSRGRGAEAENRPAGCRASSSAPGGGALSAHLDAHVVSARPAAAHCSSRVAGAVADSPSEPTARGGHEPGPGSMPEGKVVDRERAAETGRFAAGSAEPLDSVAGPGSDRTCSESGPRGSSDDAPRRGAAHCPGLRADNRSPNNSSTPETASRLLFFLGARTGMRERKGRGNRDRSMVRTVTKMRPRPPARWLLAQPPRLFKCAGSSTRLSSIRSGGCARIPSAPSP